MLQDRTLVLLLDASAHIPGVKQLKISHVGSGMTCSCSWKFQCWGKYRIHKRWNTLLLDVMAHDLKHLGMQLLFHHQRGFFLLKYHGLWLW